MTGLIILAAGASERLGQPKQNLLLQGKTLLQRTIQSAFNSDCRPIFLITGANADLIETTIEYFDIKVIHNSNWHEGIASSIKMAVMEAEKDAQIHSLLILLCDQPFVDAELINNMLRAYKESGKAIVACQYKDTIGVPVLFSKTLFPKLLLLKGDEGAKYILKDHQRDIAIIPFENGSIDIDTQDDYNRLTNS